MTSCAMTIREGYVLSNSRTDIQTSAPIALLLQTLFPSLLPARQNGNISLVSKCVLRRLSLSSLCSNSSSVTRYASSFPKTTNTIFVNPVVVHISIEGSTIFTVDSQTVTEITTFITTTSNVTVIAPQSVLTQQHNWIC